MDGGTGESLQNQDPAFITDSITYVISLLQSYGWYLLAVVVLGMYLKVKFGSFSYMAESETAAYKKTDSGEAMKRQEALERARAKMQAQLDSQAEQYREMMKEKEEKKRQEKLADWEADQQGKSRPKKLQPITSTGTSTSNLSEAKPKKPSLRPEYNPLMGGSGGSCFRPTRRGGAGGG